jgi:putative endonuclease
MQMTCEICPETQKRRAAYAKGRNAEDRAAKMLERKGYQILSRRYRSPAGEIDLVAARNTHLAFIEVKARRNLDDAALSITPNQQRRIANAAGYWLQDHPTYSECDMSFDAVLFAPKQMAYIPGAFECC